MPSPRSGGFFERAAALVMDRFFDVPIRRRLTKRLFPRPRTDRAAEALDSAL